MFDILSFSGIELIGFILIVGAAIIVEEKIAEIDALIEDFKLEIFNE